MPGRICLLLGITLLEQILGRAGENFKRGNVRKRRFPRSMETETACD